MALGLYISVPFCRSKCSYCNFASDVFSRAVHRTYVDRICDSIQSASNVAAQAGGRFDPQADSIFLGGGTPTLLDMAELERIFVTIRSTFEVTGDAEITVECAPGTITRSVIEAFQRCGVNRVSLGAQSFVDREAASVGRLHNRETVTNDISRLRSAGISNINVDVIAGLPHQTPESWRSSLARVLDCEVRHVSVYMLEVDEDSRLGREVIAGGTRYHAHLVPDEDLVAEFYQEACETLNGAGICQYEISNFAQPGLESRHNLKYWTRRPYIGFGVDAHSMLLSSMPDVDAVRYSTADSLEVFMRGASAKTALVTRQAALEETFFLGLRLTEGVDLSRVEARFGDDFLAEMKGSIDDCVRMELLERQNDRIKLTDRGRLLSNEVFERFISVNA